MAPELDPLETQRRQQEAQKLVPAASGARATTAPAPAPAPAQPVAVAQPEPTRRAAPRNPALDDFYKRTSARARPADTEIAISPSGGAVGAARATSPQGVTRTRTPGGKIGIELDAGAAETHAAGQKATADFQAQKAAALQEEQTAARAVRDVEAEQGVARSASNAILTKGMSVPQRQALARLQGSRQAIDQSRERASIDAEARNPGRAVDRAGTRLAGGGVSRTPDRLSNDLAQDWRQVHDAWRVSRPAPTTLAEYEAQFNELKASVGPSVGRISDVVKSDFVANMPQQVREEYQNRILDIDAEAVAQRTAKTNRITQLAKAELLKETAPLRAAATKLISDAGAEGTVTGRETGLEATAGVRRTRTATDIASKSKAIEAAADDALPSKLRRAGETARAQAESAEEVADSRQAGVLRRAGETAEAKRMSKAELERKFGPDLQGEWTRTRQAFADSETAFQRVDQKYRIAIQGQVIRNAKKDVIGFKPPDADEAKAALADRNIAYARREQMRLDLDQLSGFVAPEAGDVPAIEAMSPEQTGFMQKYNEKLTKMAEEGLTTKEMGKLDKLWNKTGQPLNQAKHRPIPFEEPPEFEPQDPGTPPRGAQRGRTYVASPTGVIVPVGLTRERLLEDLRAGRINQDPEEAIKIAERIVAEQGWE